MYNQYILPFYPPSVNRKDFHSPRPAFISFLFSYISASARFMSSSMSSPLSSQTLPSAIVPEIEIRMHERRGLRIVRKTALFRRGPGGVKTLDNTTIEDVVTEFLAGYEDALARLEKG